MELDTRSKQGVTILQVTGRLDATNAQEFEKMILDLLASEPGPLLLNLEKLEYISSAGLRVLILALKKEEERKKGFALCCMQANVKDVLEIAGFLPLFSIFPTEQEGLDGLGK